MKIQDRIYGQFNIEEPILIELINSQPVQRLKGINQAGASQYALPNKDVTRYEHSVGVMLLLRILQAPLEEQIAGLLHDVPHTAFSHVIDYVFDNKDHEFHEKFHEQIILKSDIPKILKKYNFVLARILNEKNFPLLEKKLPDLCADRIDYALRDRASHEGDTRNVKKYLSSLRIVSHEIVFNDKDVALSFAKDFLVMDYRHWSHPMEIALFQILADAIKIALSDKIVTTDDLFADDDFVYNKLKKSGNKKISGLLEKLSSKLKISFDENNYDFYSKNKLRFVDPKFIDKDQQLKRVTEAWPDFVRELKKHQDWAEQGHYIKILSW